LCKITVIWYRTVNNIIVKYHARKILRRNSNVSEIYYFSGGCQLCQITVILYHFVNFYFILQKKFSTSSCMNSNMDANSSFFFTLVPCATNSKCLLGRVLSRLPEKKKSKYLQWCLDLIGRWAALNRDIVLFGIDISLMRNSRKRVCFSNSMHQLHR